MHADFERTLQLSVDLKILKILPFLLFHVEVHYYFIFSFVSKITKSQIVCLLMVIFFVSLSQHTIFFGEFLSPKVCVVFLFDDLNIIFWLQTEFSKRKVCYQL